jgi:hypothetical protein
MLPVTLNPYSQVTFETNRYSVPVEAAFRQLVLKAYPFQIEIRHSERVVAPSAQLRLPAGDLRPAALPAPAGTASRALSMPNLRQWRARWAPIYEHCLLQAERLTGTRSPSLCASWAPSRSSRRTDRAGRHSGRRGCAHLDGPVVPACARASRSALPWTFHPAAPGGIAKPRSICGATKAAGRV